jgi:hypothetical protein
MAEIRPSASRESSSFREPRRASAGESLIITPIKGRSLLRTLQALRPIAEDFPRIDEPPAEQVDL